MTLRLPEPLPYEYIDEWINQDLVFYVDKWMQEIEGVEGEVELQMPYATMREGGERYRGAFASRMFVLKNDDDYASIEYDDEGYATNASFYEAMYWTAKELTDEQIDKHLELIL